MDELYEKFQSLKVDTSFIGLSRGNDIRYFCTPIGSTVIGWDDCIHYVFINGFGEMVFAVNPETCCDYYVYPLAYNFSDFLSLVLAVKGTNTLEQIILWNKSQYIRFINSPIVVEYTSKSEVRDVLESIRSLGITQMKCPFEYVKAIQNNFDYSRIPFDDEYYDATGREKIN